MPKPAAAHAPFSPQTLPPNVRHMFAVTTCPTCNRLAFGVIEHTQPALVGQRPSSRLAGVECPWCLSVVQYTPPDAAERILLPLDMAAQVRQGLTMEGAGADSASGEGLIDSGENDAKPEAEGTEAAEARGDA